MPQSLACPNGHFWEPADTVDVSAFVCPVCGSVLGATQSIPIQVTTVGAQPNTVHGLSCPDGSIRSAAAELPAIPSYEILTILGRGGMGVVYRARHIKLKRQVALKMLRAGAQAGPEHHARFRREAETIARLQHPNVVQIHEVGEHDGMPYLSMEYVAGGSLRDKLAGMPLPPREAATLTETLARAMDAVHQLGVIHRDLKPGNVLLTNTGIAKISDFGLAKQLGEDSGQTHTGQILGTPSYMAPEQAAGNVQTVGAPADIYALGGMLYEMLTGGPPFKAASVLDTLEQVRTQEAVPPGLLQPKTPRDLDTICLKCLQKDPAKRYASAAELADDLRRWLAGEPILARPVSLLDRTWRSCKRNPALATAHAAVLVALATFVVAFFVVKGSLDQEQLERGKAEAFAKEKVQLASDEQEQRVKAEKLAADNKELAKKESRARMEADLDREQANTFGIRAQFDQYFAKAGENPHETLVGMASLLPKAARLKDQALSNLLRVQVGVWSGRMPQLQAVLERELSIYAVALSADGAIALTPSENNTAQLWDTATGQPIGRPLQHQARVNSVALSADGAIALTGSGVKTAWLWDTATGQPIGPPLQHQARVGRVALSADGAIALTGSEDKTARLWKTATGQPIGPPLQHQDMVYGVALSADGAIALTGSYDKTARFWETATGQPIGPPLKFSSPVSSVALSADGTTALIGDGGKTARLWKTATGQPIGPPLHSDGILIKVALSADGKTALIGDSEKRARFWDTATGQPIGPSLVHSGPIWFVALSANGKKALIADGSKRARFWQAPTEAPSSPPLQHQEEFSFMALSADGTTALTGSHFKTAQLWKTATGQPIGPPLRHPNPNSKRMLSADGTTALTRDFNTAYLWDAATGQPIGLPLIHPDPYHFVAMSANGTTVLTGGDDKTARLWKMATGTQIKLPLLHQNKVSDGALSADGTTALTRDSFSAYLWDTATGKQKTPPLRHQNPLTAMALSADGKMALTGSDDALRLWDTATGKQIGPPLMHYNPIGRIVPSANGKTALTLTHDMTMRLWATVTGQMIAPPKTIRDIFVVALSADGAIALTHSKDMTLLWDVATGKQIIPPQWHQSFGYSAAMSADGKTVLTRNTQNSARLWKVPQPMRGDPERIKLWTEVITGLEADERIGVRPLAAAAWQQRRQRLQELGGPPVE